MPGIFQSLDIARRALWASRLGMDVTSHNIANVNTQGYSRQRVHNRTARPLQLPQGQLGLGVQTESIVRIRSRLLDSQFRQNASALGNSVVKEDMYMQIESIIQEPSSDALGDRITDFFSGFSSLASDPENTTLRNTLRQKASALTESFHTKHNQLNAMKQSLRTNAGAAVDQINEMTRQIATLNRQIATAEAGSGTANDLRDRRDLIMDRLGEYVKIDYTENSRGQVSVHAGSLNLVSGTKSNELVTKTIKENGSQTAVITDEHGRHHKPNTGKLGGLLEMHNEAIPSLLDKLDRLANHVAEEVNQLHRSGHGLPTGDPPTANTGIDFFTGNSAGTIRISQEISNDVSNIAASSDGTPGNGDIAFAISNLRNQKVLGGGSQTLNEYYNMMVNDLGIDIQKAQNNRNSGELLKDQIMNQREAKSGVSLDEEMTNMIQYQRSFEAASKVVQTVDEVLQTVINMV